MERWNKRKTELEKLDVPPNVRELVEGAATRYGDRQAWNFFESGETVTFQEAAKLARKAAGALAAIGVHKGSVVAVMLPNSPLYLATWLGLGYLGAIIAPVNGRYTTGEVEHVLKVSGASKLIVGQRYEELLSTIDSAVLPDRDIIDGVGTGPDSWASRVATADESFVPDDEPVADDPVSIQFTSGTTGFPKGCTLTHRSWLHSAVAFAGHVDEPIERFLCNQNLFYLDGQLITLVNLTRGTTTYYCAAPSVSKFDGWLRQYRIQEVFYFDPLFAAEPQGGPEEYDLRVIHIFGFNRKRHQELQDRYPGSVVRESYGMTEYAPALVMPMDADALNGSGSCGLPAPHTELRIVDESEQDVPRGTSGELILRGPGMMRGYYNNPTATGETIREGWLHTGDLFRQDEDGFYYIVGRKKDMIRRNAENIACVEVESVLRLHPGIREAAVVPVPDDVVGEEIKAYILPAGGPLDPGEIIDFCALHLAKFKVPRYVAFVDSFVMTESARVEKKRLVQGVEDLTADAFDASLARGVQA